MEMKWLERSPHDLRVLCLIAAELVWDGREEAQEAQEGVGFDAEEGSVVEERSGLGIKWLERSPHVCAFCALSRLNGIG